MFSNYHIYTSNSSTFEARGVAIFVNSHLDFGLIDCITDRQGNILTIHCSINGRQLAIIGFYGPRSDNSWFYGCLRDATNQAKLICEDVIVMGDFNMFFQLHKDSYKYKEITKPRAVRIIKQTMKDFDLIDIYRHLKPKATQISWRKWNTTKGARLDFCLLNSALAEFVTDIDYLPPPLATLDHSICLIKLKFSNTVIGPGLYRVPFNIEKDEHYCQIIEKVISQSILDNYEFDSDTTYICQELAAPRPQLTHTAETFKQEKWRSRPGYVLQEVINNIKENTRHFVKSRNVEFKKKLNNLMREMKVIYDEAITNDDPEALKTFYELQERYLNASCEYHGLKVTTADKFRDVFGEQPNRYFFAARGEKKQRKTFQKIQLPDGSETEDNDLINTAIYEFWNPIYNSDKVQSCSVDSFLSEHLEHLPKLLPDEADHLERPISEAEIAQALKTMKTGAAAGFDGIGVAWIRKFYHMLSPLLLATYRDAQQTGFLPEFMKYAVITLIPKQGKRSMLSNWRPISVLPSTFKIYGTLIANRLKPLCDRLIHSDQKAYIAGRQIADVHYNLISEGDHIIKNSGKATLVQIDYSKAFDSVHFSAVQETLIAFGFSHTFITMVMSTVQGRTASLNINGKLSPIIVVNNGMPQGDPLAPLLFILVMEPLLHKLRSTPQLIAANRIKLQGFADDLTLLLKGTAANILLGLKIIEDFTSVSGLRLNSQKTTLLNIGHDGYKQEDIGQLNQTDKVKILGIKFNNVLLPIDENYHDKVNKMNISIARWNKSYLNLPGRLIVAKSVLLPIFTNLGILPASFHRKFSWELDKKCSLFIFSGQHKIAVKQGYLPYNQGGVKQLSAEQLWISLRMKMLKSLFDNTDAWAQPIKSALLELNITHFSDFKTYSTFMLKDIATRIDNYILTQLIEDLIRFQVLFVETHPSQLLNELAFFNHWGSYKSPRLQVGPRIAHKSYDYQFGLRPELLPQMNPDCTYNDMLQYTLAFDGMNAQQKKYLKTFSNRIKKIVSPEIIAIFTTSDRMINRIAHSKKPRSLLNMDTEFFSPKLYAKWLKILPFIPAQRLRQLFSIKLFETDSRIIDFQLRHNLLILGFRRDVAKYKTAVPNCYRCDDASGLHEYLHTFLHCEFAIAVRKLAQDVFQIPGSYNLNTISPDNFCLGLTFQEASTYDLNYYGINRLLLMIKYAIWVCSMGDNDNSNIHKALDIIKGKMYGRFLY